MTRHFLAPLVCLGILSTGVAVAGDDVRDAIKKLKTSKKAEERILGAKLLRGRDTPEVIDALALALQDKDAGVREEAASVLWNAGKKAKAAEPALRRALDDPEPRVVASAAGALEMMDVDAKELAAARRRALSETKPSDHHTAFLAARGLIGLDPPATVLRGLLPYLASMSEAAAKPGGSDYRDAVEATEQALERLAKTKDRSAIPLLLDELDRSAASAPSLLKALGAYKPPAERFAQILVKQMHVRDPKTRHAAVARCRDLTSDADVAVWAPEATALLRDPDGGVRMETLWAIHGAGGRAAAAVPDVVRLLKEDSSGGVRARAAEVLGDIGDSSQAVSQQIKLQVAEQVKGPLVAALSDKAEDVAKAALNAYNRLVLPRAELVNTLIQVAEGSGPPRLRQGALLFLRNLSGQAKPVLERVRALATSGDKAVADDARYAVESIEHGGRGTSNPVVTGPAAPKTASGSPAPAAGASAAKRDPGAEARGLAKLREMKLGFNVSEFARSLSHLQPDAVQAFLDAGMSAGQPIDGMPPLTFLLYGSTCPRGKPTPEATREIVKVLLAGGADVNQKDDAGNTALLRATGTCDRPTVRMLVVAGAKVGLRNTMNYSPLENALVLMNLEVAEELISAGARLNAQEAKDYAERYKGDPKLLALVKKATP